MKKFNVLQLMAVVYFVATSIFWLWLLLTHHKGGNLNYWYSFLFGLTPLVGGLIGMARIGIWGGLKSAIGRGVFFISLGLFLWGFGESIWSYYNFFKHVAAPYPSLADLGFAPSVFFWVLGMSFMARATGARLMLKRKHWAKIAVVLIPIILLLPSYYIQIKVALGGTLIPKGETPLRAILDIAYPFGDFLALTFAVVIATLSYKYLGGIYKKAILFLLLGLAVMYCADSVFSYTTTKNTYYNADWGDLLLSLGQTLMTVGILAYTIKPTAKPIESHE